MRARVAALLTAAALLAGGCAGAPKGPATCAAWGCHEEASAPLAWTRPDVPGRGLDISSHGDLCPRHVAKAPFVLAPRFLLVFGFAPALAFGYLTFRVLWVYDRHGPGLARFGEARGRQILFGLPLVVFFGWWAFFVLRAIV